MKRFIFIHPSFSYLLDLYPNAYQAFSVRKLRSAYAGNCIRVRRASDNAESDIGFVNNYIDTTTLLAFCAGTDGYITTWYNQAGGAGANLTMTTAGNQPTIVVSGALITLGTKATSYFDPSRSSRMATGAIDTSNTITSFVVGKRKADNVYFISWWGLANASSGSLRHSNADTYIIRDREGNSTGLADNTAIYSIYSSLLPNLVNGRRLRKNGAEIALTHTSAAQTTNYSNFGNASTNYSDAYFQEAILYLSDQSANFAAIETNQNAYYAAY